MWVWFFPGAAKARCVAGDDGYELATVWDLAMETLLLYGAEIKGKSDCCHAQRRRWWRRQWAMGGQW